MFSKVRIIPLVIACLILLPVVTVANSMEPPGLIVIVEGSHNIDNIIIDYNDHEAVGMKKEWPFETQFWFYRYQGYTDLDEAVINIDYDLGVKTYTLPILEKYNTTYTINLDSDTVQIGKSPMRSIMLVSFRVILTLLIEGAVFWLFGFRKKRSWIAFLVINLVTQTFLNLYMNDMNVAASYPIIMLIFVEFWVFLAEMIAFPIIIKEFSKPKCVGYAFVANMASLVLGAYILFKWLPI